MCKENKKCGQERMTQINISIYLTKIITCLKYVQNNKIKRLTAKANVLQFNGSFVLVS